MQPKIITPQDGGHYFFGYYDLQPFDSTGRYHLCHKAPFENRIPAENDICELGMIDLQTNRFIPYAETTAWNFQQGALLRWYRDDQHILFNTREGCCILDICTGEKKILPRAIADVSKDGNWGLCINFARIFDFRPGYGYAGMKDPYFDEKAPSDDGVFLMNMETGEARLIADYPTLREVKYQPPYSDCKLLINHINFNPSGTHYVMLFRNFYEPGSRWATQLLAGDLQGNLRCLGEFGVYSHYAWKNDRELLIFCKQDGKKGLYLFDIHTGDCRLLDAPHPEQDIHCLYSPCGRYVSGDGYPEADDCRALHLIDTQKKTDTVLCRSLAWQYTKDQVEFRTDLHARFDPTGKRISYDSNHIGSRCICLLEL